MDTNDNSSNEEIIIEKLDDIIGRINNGEDSATIKILLEELKSDISEYASDIKKGAVRNFDYSKMVSILIQHFTITVAIVGSDGKRNTATCFFVKIDDTVYAITNKCIWHSKTADFAKRNGRNAELSGRSIIV